MKYAVIFDLDGTLWDAADAFKVCYDECMKERGEKIIYTCNDFKAMMGYSPKDIIERIVKDTSWSATEAIEFYKGFYPRVLEYLKSHPGKIYEGSSQTLSLLKEKYNLYIVSNSSYGYVESYLNSSGLASFFSSYLQAGDTGLSKADNILKLIKEEKIDKAVYVGDTLKDYLECEKANVPFIYASYGFGRVDKYKYKINCISDLIEIKNLFFD